MRGRNEAFAADPKNENWDISFRFSAGFGVLVFCSGGFLSGVGLLSAVTAVQPVVVPHQSLLFRDCARLYCKIVLGWGRFLW